LTNEYIAGRRVKYLPPFRMYLIFSLLFFLVAAIPEFEGFNNLSPEERAELVQELQSANEQLLDIPSRQAAEPEPLEIGSGNGFTLSSADDCANVSWENFLGQRLGARALASCQTAFSDNGVSLMQSFFGNLPIMMFVCVPLLAVFMKLFYLFKKRKYVEHLMFLFHTHSFIFALAILTVLLIRATEPFPALESAVGLTLTICWFYALVYAFLALKKVYGQGALMTSFKLLMLFPAYSICLALVFVSGLFLTFITI
jgi:hypothetical protein